MDREYISDRIPDKLVERLEAAQAKPRFRRRAVLTKAFNGWQLVCCTIEEFVPGESVPVAVPARRYRQAILYEDFLTGAECLKFANGLQEGHARFGDIDLERDKSASWSTELLPVENDYMVRAGCVVSLRFAQDIGRPAVNTLLVPDEPYYPDIDAAAGDWLPLRVYHGGSDGRNDHVIFLLPETRAFIASAVLSQEGALELTVAGSELDALDLVIKGAYWDGKKIRHLNAAVSESKATLMVSTDAERLEYFLIDRAGTVYDFHKEWGFTRLGTGGGTLAAAKRTLTDQVKSACEQGEGQTIEFKPFVSPSDGIGSTSRKTKLREVLTTVVAFANAEGGHIYLGVEDDCTIVGIDHEFRAWAEGAPDESAIAKYLGGLKNKIKSVVHGDLMLRLAHVVVNNALVVVVEVQKAAQKPISIHDDHYLYVRKAASNRKLPPDQWRSVLQSDQSGSFLRVST